MKIALSRTARRVLRALVALVIVTWLARRVGVDAIMSSLTMADIGLLAAATALLALDGFSKAWNWQQLLARSIGEQRIAYWRVIMWFFAGGFLGAIVPSSASTDACRVVLAARGLSGNGAACTASVVTLNALGWFTGCLIGLTGLGILLLDAQLPPVLGPVTLIFLGTLTALPVAYALLAAKRSRVLAGIAGLARRWRGLYQTLTRFVEALLVFEHAHVRIPPFLLVAALGLLAQTGMFALTAKAVGIELPFAVWMVLVPLTRIVALIPVSIADFGLIQAAHVWVLAMFGVPAWDAFALSALFAIEGLVIHSTLGAAAFLGGGWVTRNRPVQMPARRNSGSTGPFSAWTD